MTIKELEQRTGMPRANIRYYEEEGLLSPRRLDNGYRDYSEEDANTLEKIKLLRSLHLDIDTIRLVQRGELPLERALFTLLTKLEGDQVALGRAAQVCRRLQASGVEYAALEPEPLLRELEGPEAAAQIPALWDEAEAKRRQAASHPWRRYLARWLDLFLAGVPLAAVLMLVFRVNLLNLGLLGAWLFGLGTMALCLLAEPILLHRWGWTPGKWAMGLELRDGSEGNLTVAAARRRCWRALTRGLGLGIPLYSLWRLWKSYRCSIQGVDCPWDEGEDWQYTWREREDSAGLFRPLLVAAAGAALLVLAALQFLMPPNRGPLTVAEYCENYNFYLDLLDPDSPERLDETGQWVPRRAGWGVTYFTSLGPPYCSDLEFDLGPEGEVIGVRFTETAYDEVVALSQTNAQAAALALAGAQRAFNCFTFAPWDWLGLWGDQYGVVSTWENHRGLIAAQSADIEGYRFDFRPNGTYVLEGEGDGARRYARTVTITWNGSE